MCGTSMPGSPASCISSLRGNGNAACATAIPMPGQLGSDRWAALIAAWDLARRACMVVNCGTAITIDTLSGQGEFRGGLILPGPDLMQRSLAGATNQLRPGQGKYAAFPLNTADALLSGAIQACCGAIERQYALLDDDSAPVVLSGGAAGMLQEHIKLPLQAVDNLVLRGLLLIRWRGGRSMRKLFWILLLGNVVLFAAMQRGWTVWGDQEPQAQPALNRDMIRLLGSAQNPPAGVLPAPVLIVAAAYSGSVEDGEPIVQPLRELAQPLIDLSGPWPWPGLQSGFDALFPKGGLYYWKSRALGELSEAAIDEIADFAARRPTPLTDIVIWHHGGAMSRVGETETAYAGRDAPFLVTGEVSWTDPSQSDEAIAWGREFWAAMERHSTGGVYLNFPGLGEEKEALVRAGYGVELRPPRRAEGDSTIRRTSSA